MTQRRQFFVLVEQNRHHRDQPYIMSRKLDTVVVSSPPLSIGTCMFSFRLSFDWPCETSHFRIIAVDMITPH